MRIVYVLTSLGMGGAERQVLALADRMAARGHTVALLILRPRLKEEWPTSLNVIRLEMQRTPFSVLAGLVRGRQFLRDFKPDVVHSHSFHANIVARLLKVLVPDISVLCTVHNVYEGGRSRMMAYRLTDVLSNRTTAVSRAAADRFVRLKAVPQRKCVVLTNGIDTAEFVPDADRCRSMRARNEVGSEFIWLAVGRVVPAKDYPNLLQAFAQVRAIKPDAQLWIAGATNAAGAGRAACFVAVGKTDSPGGVHWLGLRRDMPALLDAADAFVLSSAWEGMPLALGEAMAMEKPVVATDVGGVRELLWACGSLVPPKDPGALATAMLKLMYASQEDRATLGRAARARIQHYFNLDDKADEWEALYKAG
jgi:glycosyltransferase involved in cell wall biosynthesis